MRILTLRCALAVVALGAAPNDACAQTGQSKLASEARATIAIRVSVRPTFQVSATSDTLTVASNSSAQFRYAVVLDPPNLKSDLAGRALASADRTGNPPRGDPRQ